MRCRCSTIIRLSTERVTSHPLRPSAVFVRRDAYSEVVVQVLESLIQSDINEDK